MMRIHSALPVLLFLFRPFSTFAIRQPHADSAPLTMSDDGLYDIYGPLKLNEFPLLFVVILGVIAAICLLVLLLYLRRRKRPQSVPLSAGVTALAELNAITILIDQPLLYTERIADILRRYLEARFAIAATNRTSEELLFSFRQGNLPDDTRKIKPFACDLAACLECIDMAKFAHLQPDRARMEEIQSTVRNFIELTERSQHSGGKS